VLKPGIGWCFNTWPFSNLVQSTEIEIVGRVWVIIGPWLQSVTLRLTVQLQPLPRYFLPHFSRGTQRPGLESLQIMWPCVTFHNKLFKLDDHPLLAVRGCLFNIFATIPDYLRSFPPSTTPKTRHAMVQKLLSSRLLSKILKIKIYEIIILPVVLYGRET
jgi:hypothetical protein